MNTLSQVEDVDLTPIKPKIEYPSVDTDAINDAAQLLSHAKNPLIFVGSGAMDATDEITNLAEILQVPIIHSPTGQGILTSRHYLSHTMIGGYKLWKKADVALAVGTRFQMPSMWGLDKDVKIIKIDVDPQEMNRSIKPDVSITARSQDALRELIPMLEKNISPRPSREEEMLALKKELNEEISYLKPQLSYLKVIREELPDDGYFVDELTQVGYTSRFAMQAYAPKTVISVGYQGTLGYGFATALGVKVAHPDKPVISVTGDGGFMFNVQELASAVRHKIGLVTLVFNDNAFGNVRRIQQEWHNGRIIASDLKNPDFVKLAESFGVQAFRAKKPETLREAIRKGFDSNEPTLIEIPVGELPNPWDMIMRPKIRG